MTRLCFGFFERSMSKNQCTITNSAIIFFHSIRMARRTQAATYSIFATVGWPIFVCGGPKQTIYANRKHDKSRDNLSSLTISPLFIVIKSLCDCARSQLTANQLCRQCIALRAAKIDWKHRNECLPFGFVNGLIQNQQQQQRNVYFLKKKPGVSCKLIKYWLLRSKAHCTHVEKNSNPFKSININDQFSAIYRTSPDDHRLCLTQVLQHYFHVNH